MTTSLQPGEIIRGAQDYEILGHLGAGGMGSIYRARDRARGDQVAIKMVIPPDDDATDSLLERLLNREATTLRQIDHRAVVRYRDFVVRPDGAKLLVMDLVPGPTLRDHVRRSGPVSWDAWLKLRDHLASGLAAVHARGIVHRDLSPDNVVLKDGRPDQPVLIDFGVARDRDATGGTIIGDRRVGKYLYASPEQLLDPSAVSTASDLYSFGLVMAFAARGSALPMGETERQAIERRRTAPDLDGLDERIRTQLSMLLRPRIEERPQSIDAFLKRVASEPASGATGTSGTKRLASTLWAAGVIVAIVLAVLAFAFVPSIRHDPVAARQREWAALYDSQDAGKLADFAARHRGTQEAELALQRLARLREPPPPAPKPQPVPPPLPPGRAIATFDVYFDYDSAELRPEAGVIVRQIVDSYRGAGTTPTTIALTGHVDGSMSAERGTELASQMANAVRDALVASGIPVTAIAVTWRGPTDGTNDEVAKARARRVEVALLQ